MLNLYLDKPIFSLVVFCSGKGNDTEKCLESLLAQTFPDFEVICVTVNIGMTREKISRLAARDPRISILLHNGGNPFNEGLAQARGEYVLFLDGDDLCEPDLLQHLYDEIIKRQSDIILFNADVRPHADLGDGQTAEPHINCASLQRNFKNLQRLKSENFQYIACRKKLIGEKRLFHQEIFALDRIFLGLTAFLCAERVSYINKMLLRTAERHGKNSSESDMLTASHFARTLYFIKSFIEENIFYGPYVQHYMSWVENEIDKYKDLLGPDEKYNFDIMLDNYKILNLQN